MGGGGGVRTNNSIKKLNFNQSTEKPDLIFFEKYVWCRGDLNPRQPSFSEKTSTKDIIEKFEEHLRINKQRSSKTVSEHSRSLRRILDLTESIPPKESDYRKFLKEYDTGNKRNYENLVKSVRGISRFSGRRKWEKDLTSPTFPISPKNPLRSANQGDVSRSGAS